MMMPKKVKHRKQHRGKNRGMASLGNKVSFGDFGLQTIDRAWIKANQIEAARKAITRFIKRGGKIWIRVFPDKPVTARPAETRMGKGKGDPVFWVAVVKPGHVLFEVAGLDKTTAKEAMRLASHKLPVRTQFIEAVH